MASVNPSENWDDDFEFQSKTTTTAMSISMTATTTTNKPNAHDHDAFPSRMSFASSDWDNEDNDGQSQSKFKEKNRTTAFEDKKNTLNISPDWVEPGPSTPKRNHHHHQTTSGNAPSTENWDDDFEDSPLRNGLPPGADKSSPSRTRPKKQQQPQPRPESWDDEFDGLAPAYHSPTRQSKVQPHPHRHALQNIPMDYSSSEDEGGRDGVPNSEFGYTSRDDEDRTVTARSRRAVLSRLSPSATSPLDNAEGTPPPPVPPIPLPFLLPETKSSTTATYLPSTVRSSSPSPFPRSPTSSVFSVPTTIRPPSSAYTVTSTTYLRPTVSRSSSGLGGLPPSPPIHRERRRLRKKSRPPGVGGGIELSVITTPRDEDGDGYDHRYDTGGEDYELDPSADMDARPKTPPPTQVQVYSTPSSPSGGGGTLLSRIGSVKKWGIRRKRGSTTPSEVVNLERLDADSRTSSRRVYDDDANLPISAPGPARPHSQASTSSVPSSSESSNAHHHHHYRSRRHIGYNTPPIPPTPPSGSSANGGTTAGTINNPPKRLSTSNSWFFRSASSSSSNQKIIKGSASDLDLALNEDRSAALGLGSGLPQTPVKNKGVREEEIQTPAKLVKRKSLGFVQLRRNLGVGGHGDDHNVREKEKEKGKERGEEKYGGLGLGRATAKEMVMDVFGGGRDQEAEREQETSGGREHETEKDKEEEDKEEEKDRDGSRGFMGSVRRISLVGAAAGRHKRTKSGVSLSNVSPVVARLDVGVGLRGETVTPTPKNVSAAVGAASNEDRAAPTTPSKTPTKSSLSSFPQDKLNSLLPPIELQPPSPPRLAASARRSSGRMGDLLSPTSSSSTVATSASAPSPTTSPSAGVRKSPLGSPQSASLGRSTIGLNESASSGVGAMRRSSLGDLKIPERISQAQVSLRKDMERVREFAAGVEQLKEQQTTYNGLVTEIQTALDAHARAHTQQQQQPPSRATSPSFFASLARPMSRHRSNTNPPAPSASTVSLAQTLAASSSATQTSPLSSALPITSPVDANSNPQLAYKQLASAYYTIRSKYRISWECAELLIDLGSGNAERGPPSTSTSAPVVPTVTQTDGALGRRKSSGRERAITLGGEDSKPPTPIPGQIPSSSASTPGMSSKSGWRASTGKHDLSQRQLILLKDILNGGDANGSIRVDDGPIPEEAVTVNRDWRWGKDPMGSTLTLPSEDSSVPEVSEGREGKLRKKRRASRLGMTGLRDMLRLLKRSQVVGLDNAHGNSHAGTPPNAAPMSSTSLSTTDNSSLDSHRYPHSRVPPAQGRRRSKTSTGPESVRLGRPTSPHGPSTSLASGKPSPRRPSLASIFRLGQKTKPTSPDLPPELQEQNHYHRQNQSPSPARRKLPRSRSASGRESSSTGEEEDWDRMDDASDMDAAARALGINQDGSATVRGKASKLHRSPYLQDAYIPSLPSLPSQPLTPRRSASESQTSLRGDGSGDGKSGKGNMTPPHPPLPHPTRVTRLSNVEEHETSQAGASLPRSSSRGSNYRAKVASSRGAVTKTGSVRSMPPQLVTSPLPDPMLAMTPDNIKPLLDNAREVHARLVECNAELRALLAGYAHR